MQNWNNDDFICSGDENEVKWCTLTWIQNTAGKGTLFGN
jgi:hypothetical protein